MDFSYPEDHLEIQTLSDRILGDHTRPERMKSLEMNGAYMDDVLWQQLLTSGIPGASLPESLGGMGMDYLAACLVAEAIGRTVAMVPYIPCIISTALPLLAWRQDSTIESLLQGVASGEHLAVTALIEPGNENPFEPSLAASPVEGQWYMSGQKQCVPYAAQSHRILLFGRNQGELVATLLDPVSKQCSLTPQRATTLEPQFLVTLDNAPVHCIATGNDALSLLTAVVAMSTVGYCAMAVGVAETMTRIAAEYTSQREQFGVPVATFQAVAHRLADCYIDTECLRIMVQKAACDVSSGLHSSDAIHMAKIWCGDVMHRVSQATQHVHGGTGIDREYHLFRHCLWAKHLELVLGGSRMHLATLADRLASRYLNPKES